MNFIIMIEMRWLRCLADWHCVYLLCVYRKQMKMTKYQRSQNCTLRRLCIMLAVQSVTTILESMRCLLRRYNRAAASEATSGELILGVRNACDSIIIIYQFSSLVPFGNSSKKLRIWKLVTTWTNDVWETLVTVYRKFTHTVPTQNTDYLIGKLPRSICFSLFKKEIKPYE